MPIEDHLTIGENILAQDGKYYATDKRIIRYEKGIFSEDLSDLAYSHISSINLISRFRYPILILIGAIITVLGIIIGKDSLMLIVGILFAIAGVLLKDAYYQFLAPGIIGKEAEKWRIYNPESDDATEFIKIVRNHLK